MLKLFYQQMHFLSNI